MKIRDVLVEFAPAGGGGSGDYFQALASAWYNGVFNTGSLPRGIKTQQDVERLLNRGIVCPDGKTRKLHIDYNSDFDGVEIYSDDYYEYGDHDDTIDSRTGQKWGPYDFMAFSDEDLSEGLNEFAVNDGDSGRWYTDDQMTDLVGDGWWQDMDVSGANIGVPDSEVPKAYMIQQAQRWLKRQGHDVQVLNVKLNDDDMEWYIEGAFVKDLTEFAADDGDSGEDDVLHKYARMWWAGDDATQQKIEAALARMGWEIGEDEGGYDNGGVFVVRAGDVNGNSYVSWAAEDLTEGVWDSIKKSFTPDPNWQKRAGQAAGHVAQGAVAGGAHGHAVGHAMADTGVHEGSDDPFGPQGRFVGDTGPARISTTVPRHELRIGDRVLYKPTEQRARIVALSRDGSQARIDMPSPMGGRVFNCKTSDLKALGQGSLEEKSTSQAQFRTMAAAAHDPAFARKVGIKPSVAREFNRADRGQDYKDLPKKADESKKAPAEKEADYGDDYQDMVKRVKKLAGLGPLKTQYDTAKRVYKNMPTAVQPKK
jgi:hypothetical protein